MSCSAFFMMIKDDDHNNELARTFWAFSVPFLAAAASTCALVMACAHSSAWAASCSTLAFCMRSSAPPESRIRCCSAAISASSAAALRLAPANAVRHSVCQTQTNQKAIDKTTHHNSDKRKYCLIQRVFLAQFFSVLSTSSALSSATRAFSSAVSCWLPRSVCARD